MAGLARGACRGWCGRSGTSGRATGDLRAPQPPWHSPPSPRLRDRLFVVDSRNDRVQVFHRAGRPTGPVIGGKGDADGKLDGPGRGRLRSSGARVSTSPSRATVACSAFDAATGAFLFAFGGGPNGMSAVGGIAVDAAGVLCHATDVGGALRAAIRARAETAGWSGP